MAFLGTKQGLRCPHCQAVGAYVKDTRPIADHMMIRRRRLCASCKARWTTYETTEKTMLNEPDTTRHRSIGRLIDWLVKHPDELTNLLETGKVAGYKPDRDVIP